MALRAQSNGKGRVREGVRGGLTGPSLPTYYFAAAGSDANDGLTQATPKQTIGAANALGLIGPSNIYFNGGDTFAGNLVPQVDGLAYGSFGTGQATISAGSGSGIVATNRASLSVLGLNIVGASPLTNTGNGIRVTNSQAGNTKLAGPSISNCSISGFGLNGIFIEGGAGSSGFNNVNVSGNTVFDCTQNTGGRAGIFIVADPAYGQGQTAPAFLNVTVSGNTVYNCKGKAGSSNWVGSGIVLGEVNGGLVVSNVAYNNGENNTSSGGNGPVGIWCYDSNAVTFRFNESYGNKTNNSADGGGFDLDGGCTNCLMEYNYSHGNMGPGFLMYSYGDGFVTLANFHDNTFRFNISENDCGLNNYAAINITGGTSTSNLRVYNNTVYQTQGIGLTFDAGSQTGCFAANNIFYHAGATSQFLRSQQASLQLRGNCYYTAGTPSWVDGNVTYSTFASWIAATSQEKISGTTVGFFADPFLYSPGTGGTVTGDFSLLTGYRLKDTSPLLNAGVNVAALYSVTLPTSDFYRNTIGAIPTNVGAYDGAGVFVADTTPNAFSFTDVTGADVSTAYTSNTITVSGINSPAAISVTGGTYSVNGGAYTSASGTVNNGDAVSVRATSSGSAGVAVNVVLTIGGVSDTYSVTTASAGSPLSFSTIFVGDPSSMVNSSGKVSSWNSLDGGGVSFVQADTTKRPVYDATTGAGFDGSALHLDCAALPVGGLATLSIFMRIEIDATSSGQNGIVCFAESGNDYQGNGFTFTTNNNGANYLVYRSAALVYGSLSPGDRIGVVFDGTNASGYRNNGTTGFDQQSAAYSTVNPSTPMAAIGSRVLSGVPDAPYYKGTIKKLVISSIALNSTQRAELDTWLNT